MANKYDREQTAKASLMKIWRSSGGQRICQEDSSQHETTAMQAMATPPIREYLPCCMENYLWCCREQRSTPSGGRHAAILLFCDAIRFTCDAGQMASCGDAETASNQIQLLVFFATADAADYRKTFCFQQATA
jgi:hypothetical protein